MISYIIKPRSAKSRLSRLFSTPSKDGDFWLLKVEFCEWGYESHYWYFAFTLNHDGVWISTKICLGFVLCVRVLIRVLCTRYSHVRRRVRICSQKLNHLGHTNYKSASMDWFGGLFAVWGSICRLRIEKRGITPPPPIWLRPCYQRLSTVWSIISLYRYLFTSADAY